MGIVIGSLEQGFIFAIMALGVYLAFRILNYPDLTVDGSFPMGAAISALLITKGVNPFLALIFAFISGGIAGLITGILHTKGKIDGLLAGILTMTALYSINLKIMGTSNLSLFRADTIFTPVGKIKEQIVQWLGATNGEAVNQWLYSFALLFVVLLLKLAIDWFLRTDIGLAIRATGDNPSMIRSFGVNTHHSIMMGLILSNALVGLAGGMMAQYQGYADVQMGIGMIVIGLASVIIGQAVFGSKSIKRSTIAVIGGAIIYRLVIAVALYLPWLSPTDMKLITAVLVIFSLTFPSFTKRTKKTQAGPKKVEQLDYAVQKVSAEKS
ncbi:ABC transporter permease [Tepidibacillus sp. HK-1]|uniref:ABC transporter permease n=1 Tax=Tepidibacillus sp. HK-1 TaxID=1883407 RepID=UPI00085347C1|nr:ABC transporter permease [Tepidibacillus sp. HK-1]GBF11270.1 ribose ABC transporter permease protein [Tepidibacillus sp. HK-1]